MSQMKNLPTGIILLISASAFVAGLIQTDLTSNSVTLSQEKKLLENRLDRMREKANDIYIHELVTINEATHRATEIRLLDIDLSHNIASMTADEVNSVYSQIKFLLEQMKSYLEALDLAKMYSHFQVNDSDYVIASEEEDGYEYTITKQYHNENKVIENQTANMVYGFLYSYLEVSSLGAPGWFYYPVGDFRTFLYTPLKAVQDEIDDLAVRIDTLSFRADRIGLGVSLTAIAVILSAAMATRINEKKMSYDLSVIQSNLDEGKTEIITESDLISIPVLLMAATLSILGVIIPIVFS
ncbi:MAG: hypothetical protein ACFFC6_00305 [Promethearchaeota archaeon]